jgi:hypothetical protein
MDKFPCSSDAFVLSVMFFFLYFASTNHFS